MEITPIQHPPLVISNILDPIQPVSHQHKTQLFSYIFKDRLLTQLWMKITYLKEFISPVKNTTTGF